MEGPDSPDGPVGHLSPSKVLRIQSTFSNVQSFESKCGHIEFLSSSSELRGRLNTSKIIKLCFQLGGKVERFE